MTLTSEAIYTPSLVSLFIITDEGSHIVAEWSDLFLIAIACELHALFILYSVIHLFPVAR